MKLSIWQQFSSNHSSNFTVMGKFETPEKADNVAEELRLILIKIGQWREEARRQFLQDEEAQELIEKWQTSMSIEEMFEIYEYEYSDIGQEDFEETLFLEHDFEFKLWQMDFVQYSHQAGLGVFSFDRFVAVSDQLAVPYETDTPPEPFEKWLIAKGGETGISSEKQGTSILIGLSCTAPDIDTTERITALAKTPPEHRQKSDADRKVIYMTNVFRYPVTGEIQQEGLNLTLIFRSYGDDSGKNLVRLIEHLRSQGCTQIEYNFRTV